MKILSLLIGHILHATIIAPTIFLFKFSFHPSVWWMSSTIKTFARRRTMISPLPSDLTHGTIQTLVSMKNRVPNPIAMAFNKKNQLLHRVQRLFDPSFKSNITMSKSQAPILVVSLVFYFPWKTNRKPRCRKNRYSATQYIYLG